MVLIAVFAIPPSLLHTPTEWNEMMQRAFVSDDESVFSSLKGLIYTFLKQRRQLAKGLCSTDGVLGGFPPPAGVLFASYNTLCTWPISPRALALALITSFYVLGSHPCNAG